MPQTVIFVNVKFPIILTQRPARLSRSGGHRVQEENEIKDNNFT
jgi:hypothetical protein